MSQLQSEDHDNSGVCSRLGDFCFLTALRRAVKAFPRSDFALRCLTSSCCPQPYRCVGNSVFVVVSVIVSFLMMGPYLVVDTLFLKPRLFKLYKRFLKEGEHVEGRIISAKPTTNNNRISITLVQYKVEGRFYLKYLAHSFDDDEDELELLVLPNHPKSACSAWTATTYVDQHSTCQFVTMILWSVWITFSVAMMIALTLQWKIHEDCRVTLLILIPTALLLVFLFVYIRNDPVQQFLLESGKEITKDDVESCGKCRNHVEEAWAGKTMPQSHCGAVNGGVFCGVPQRQTMDDRCDDDDDDKD